MVSGTSVAPEAQEGTLLSQSKGAAHVMAGEAEVGCLGFTGRLERQ